MPFEDKESFYSLPMFTENQACDYKKKIKRELHPFKIKMILIDKADKELLAKILAQKMRL